MTTATATLVNTGGANSMVFNDASTVIISGLALHPVISKNEYRALLRFPQVTIPEGKNIVSAKIKLYCTANNSYPEVTDVDASFFAKDAPNPFYVSTNVPYRTNRPLPTTRIGTSSKLTAPLNLSTSGATGPFVAPFNALRYADVTDIVNTLYGKYSYSSPAAMTFMGIPSVAGTHGGFFIYGKTLGPTKQPALIIEYTDPVPVDKTTYQFV